MDTSVEFREFAAAMAEYISNYWDNIRERRVLPSVEPGYMRPLIPAEAPEKPENWKDVMADIERVIMPGVTHWQSPQFHAYFPSSSSYPTIVADMLSGAIACLGVSWIACPACTELEVLMMDWLGKMLDLPAEFLNCTPGGRGGGVIQSTASEVTLLTLLGAKTRAVQQAKQKNPTWTELEIAAKLVGYTSEQAHSSVERAGLLGSVNFHHLEVDETFRLRGDTLQKAIREDRAKGLIPFYVVATLGTTSVCSFDVLEEIGPICSDEKIWLHVDAAYAGSAFICPEFRHLMKGVQHAESFNFNPHKWMLVNFDCSVMWLKEPKVVINAFKVDPVYLRSENGDQAGQPDYRHWQIPLSRRFRSLKLWFVLRLFGVEYLQNHIRKQVALARKFGDLVRADRRFEIIGEIIVGLVCFRLKDSNEINEKLLGLINSGGKIHLIPAKIKQTYFLRFVVCSRFTDSEDVRLAWYETQRLATALLRK